MTDEYCEQEGKSEKQEEEGEEQEEGYQHNEECDVGEEEEMAVEDDDDDDDDDVDGQQGLNGEEEEEEGVEEVEKLESCRYEFGEAYQRRCLRGVCSPQRRSLPQRGQQCPHNSSSNVPTAGWKKLLRWSAEALGLRWGAYQSLRGAIKERLAQRMAALGCDDVEEYRKLLVSECGAANEAELRKLEQSVLQIDISRFFRTGGLWQFLLAVVLPELVRACADAGERCRCWIMGGGLGEEVYSLKACWELGLAHVCIEKEQPALDIVVSEISQDGVDFAQAGVYGVLGSDFRRCRQRSWAAWDSSGAETFREVPESWRPEIFSTLPNGDMRVKRRLRKGIDWRCESWSAPLEKEGWLEEVGGPFHLVLGRHGPFFYPDLHSQRQLIAFAASSALRAGGVLVIGRDESRLFARRVAPRTPELMHVARPRCLCGDHRLPCVLFGPKTKKVKRAGTAARPKRCGACAARVGNPGNMVWRKQ